jgi:hypothetical protein
MADTPPYTHFLCRVHAPHGTRRTERPPGNPPHIPRARNLRGIAARVACRTRVWPISQAGRVFTVMGSMPLYDYAVTHAQ